jgi:hypothetical protein
MRLRTGESSPTPRNANTAIFSDLARESTFNEHSVEMSGSIFYEPMSYHESHDIYLANFIVGFAVAVVMEPTLTHSHTVRRAVLLPLSLRPSVQKYR